MTRPITADDVPVPHNIELWEDDSGGLMLVDETDKRGYRGVERVWFNSRDGNSESQSSRFRVDAIDFCTLGGYAQYKPMSTDDVNALYDREGEPGAAVNVASYEDGHVDVWDAPRSGAAKWYLGGEQ